MNPPQYPPREDDRERREEASTSQSYPPAPAPAQASSSPFAFAPPPLHQQNRPSHLAAHHSEPNLNSPTYPYYPNKALTNMATHNSFNYGGSPAPPMGYRSYSNESTPAVQRASPQTLNRATSYHMMSPAGNSPASQQSSSPYVYQRQVSGQEPEGYAAHPSPSQRALYPPSQHVSGPYYPQAADMPRSLSYPSYAQPYPSPGAYMSAPMHPPSLARHNTTQALSSDGMSMRQGISYNFGTRLPIIDRPFKCDECVQSFNRNHDLKRHKRIHLAVKPFGCDKCGKTFSRKDALRRHWLVKGCRGEEGATAIITPMFPINARPAHSPPSPTSRRISPEYAYGPAPLNIPPVSTESQVIVTPDDVPQGSAPMDEPMVVDSATSLSRGGSSGENGYFDGVVGLKQDGYHSPYASKFASPVQATRHQQHQQHHQGNASPSYEKTYSPSGKPQFAAPFSSQQQGYLQEGMHGAKMEKQGSADGSDPGTWQRWHRPSFPFPPPPGVNYNQYDSAQVEAGGPSRQGYAG